MILQFYSELQKFLGLISMTKIFGVVPLGMILHISISAAITLLLLKRGMKFKYVCLIVFGIGLLKEILDCFVLNNTLQKHIMDMCYDMSYPAIIFIRAKLRLAIRKAKAKTKS